MIKKNLLTLICLSSFLFSCGEENVPDGIIAKKRMVQILMDMNITDAYLDQVPVGDTLLMQAHSRYNYIFRKYAIDSVKFSKSLTYYSKRPDELQAMYQTVMDSITAKQDALKPDTTKRVKKKPIKKVKKINDISTK